MVQSGTLLTEGTLEVGKYMVSSAQKSIRQGIGAAQEMLQAKTLVDVMAAQTRLTKTGADEWVAGSAKLAEMSAKVVDGACALLTGRVSAAIRVLSRRRWIYTKGLGY